MKLITTIILIISFNYIATSQVITRRAIENTTAIPPGGNPTPPVTALVFPLSDGITIRWTASTDADGIRAYEMYVNGVYNISVPSNILTYTVDGLSQNTVYDISVKAVDNVGNKSAFSNVIRRRTLILHGPQQFTSNQAIINEFLSLTIEGYEFRGPSGAGNGHIIEIIGSTSGWTMRNCYFNTFNPNNTDGGGNKGLYVNNASNITIDSCFFSHLGGGLSTSTTGGNLVVTNNQFFDIIGPHPSGSDFNLIFANGAGNRCQYNKGEAFWGEGYPEDHGSLYASNGTSASRFLVQFNLIRGGGPASSGGGFVSGEEGGSYVDIDFNRGWMMGNYGFGTVGGTNNRIRNNACYQLQRPWSNNGILCYSDGNPQNVTVTGDSAYIICGQVGVCGVGALNNYYYDNYTGTAVPPFVLQADGSDFPFPTVIITYAAEDKLCKMRVTTAYRQRIINAAATQDGIPADDIDRPRPNAGVDQTISGTTATLNGTASQAGIAGGSSAISAYLWTQATGPKLATLATPNAASCNISGLIPGIYTFRLKAIATVPNYSEQHDWMTLIVN